MAEQRFNSGDRVVDLKRLRAGTIQRYDGAGFYLLRFDGMTVNRWVEAKNVEDPAVDFGAACIEAFRSGVPIPELYRRFGRRLADELLIRIKQKAA